MRCRIAFYNQTELRQHLPHFSIASHRSRVLVTYKLWTLMSLRFFQFIVQCVLFYVDKNSPVDWVPGRVARSPPTKYGRFLSISSSMQPMLTRQGPPTPTVYCTYKIKHSGPKSVLFRQNRRILICFHCSIYNEWNNHIWKPKQWVIMKINIYK